MAKKLLEGKYKVMKAFIAYRFTGESTKELEPFLNKVVSAFRARGIDTYCSLFDEPQFQRDGLSGRQIFDYTFSIVDSVDLLFVIQRSNAKSEGMLMEIGYCLAKHIPIVVAQHVNVGDTYVHELSQGAFRYDTVDDLCHKIALFDLSLFKHAG